MDGFTTAEVTTDETVIHIRSAGSGPPILF
jgi:hypothetical protein